MNVQHAPRFLETPASSDIVVFIHGFMGSPCQFDELAGAVHRLGCSAASLLLPGHGGSSGDFSSGTFARWQGHVDAEISRLSCEYNNIWLAGHSMGGLLAINAAVGSSGSVRGIFTLACPFKLITFSAHTAKVRVRQAFGGKNDPVKSAYLRNSSVSPSPGLIWHTRKPAAELKILMSTARSNLPNVRVPVTAVYSTSDELTSIVSLDILKEELTGAKLAIVRLTESLHAYYTEKDQAVIEEALLGLIFSSGAPQTA